MAIAGLHYSSASPDGLSYSDLPLPQVLIPRHHPRYTSCSLKFIVVSLFFPGAPPAVDADSEDLACFI